MKPQKPHPLPRKKKSRLHLVIGIQGGKGSFNEQAIRALCEKKKISDYEIVYCFTTKNVLKALAEGKINRGLFAIQNSLSGMVLETINALSEYNCKILESFQLNISHALYTFPGVSMKEVDTILSHPVALGQCKKTLARKYPGKKLVSGTGKLIDQATAAKALSLGKLPRTTAVLASSVCGEFYPLDIQAKNLRDRRDNFTTFLFVSRFER
ncbi:MAG TPA: prephenate dehydratase domain-containing protein [Candidatus Paceibacterota bacterium]|nr:prephenate dehydratase domain-containing protein [Candidatus Paceibacterota bacterium]